jgi:hypothetical protein
LERIQSFNLNENKYEYAHISKLRLVDSETWGDFALCEILTPLPPHFNVSYAGWNSSLNFSGGIDIMSPCGTPLDYYGIHHPRGDIKKLSTTNDFIKGETPIASGCYVITTVVDVLFGWIWGNSVSTQVICNYVDNPWLTVANWCEGGIENGSSGSGFFDRSGNIIGVLSGGIFECSGFAGITTYGKFRNNYFRSAVKNTLNPSNELLVDLFGLPSRKITCYNSLTLPGVEGVSKHYFPASHYQSDNTIVLQALHELTIADSILVHPGADYRFYAGDVINVELIDIKEGATVEITPDASCFPTLKTIKSNTDYPNESENNLLSLLQSKKGRYYRWEVTRSGITETFYDTIYLEAGEQRTYEILY